MPRKDAKRFLAKAAESPGQLKLFTKVPEVTLEAGLVSVAFWHHPCCTSSWPLVAPGRKPLSLLRECSAMHSRKRSNSS